MEFWNSYGIYLIIFLGFVGFGGYVAWTLKTKGPQGALDEFREIAFQLMLAAEKKFSDGDEKFKYVIEKLYVVLPDMIKYIFTEDEIRQWVQDLYDEFIIDYLDDGLLNDSNKS